MNNINLPFPDCERRFWQSLGRNWVDAGGLTIGIVPKSYNNISMGKWVRNWACHSVDPEIEYHDPIDLRKTYCYDLSSVNKMAKISGKDVLKRALANINKEETASNAATGGDPFYLIITGIEIPDGENIPKWSREVLGSWPSAPASFSENNFHCCIVLTSLYPATSPPVPEGSRVIIIPSPRPNELLSIVKDTVESIWVKEEPTTIDYLSYVANDMSSGWRVDAEKAIEFLSEQWNADLQKKEDWRPWWIPDCHWVQEAKTEIEGSDFFSELSRLDDNLRAFAIDINKLMIGNKLWALGYWKGQNESFIFPSGLTALGLAAFNCKKNKASFISPYISGASTNVFSNCLLLEQNIKHRLITLVNSRPELKINLTNRLGYKTYFDKDKTWRDYFISKGDDLLQQLPTEIDKNDPSLIIAISSFGSLKTILSWLLPMNSCKEQLSVLNNLVDARNTAAHGGWFSLCEYKKICCDLSLGEKALTELRI